MRAPDAVVLDDDLHVAVAARRRDARLRCTRVLRDVRQRLAGNEVRGRLHRLWQALVERRERDWERRAHCERLERGPESFLGQDGRMHPARELAKLADRDLQLDDGLLEQPLELRVARRSEHSLGAAKLQTERNEALLRTVVDVPFDPPPLLVGRGDDPRARLLYLRELGASLGVQARVLQ